MGATLTFARGLAEVGLAQRDGVYWAGRATLVTRPEQIATYDRVFAGFWSRIRSDRADDEVVEEIVIALDVPGDRGRRVRTRPRATRRPGPDRALEPDRGAAPARLRGVHARRVRRGPQADGRPAARGRAPGISAPAANGRSRGAPDLRRTVRRSLRAGGEPVRRAFFEPGERTRRVVLLLDVSGSMEPYARAFVRFLHAAVVSRARVEAFALGTRLTRVTRELMSHDPDAAVRDAARRVVDWSGGTRLGEGLRAFNDTWGIGGMARGRGRGDLLRRLGSR